MKTMILDVFLNLTCLLTVVGIAAIVGLYFLLKQIASAYDKATKEVDAEIKEAEITVPKKRNKSRKYRGEKFRVRSKDFAHPISLADAMTIVRKRKKTYLLPIITHFTPVPGGFYMEFQKQDSEGLTYELLAPDKYENLDF